MAVGVTKTVKFTKYHCVSVCAGNLLVNVTKYIKYIKMEGHALLTYTSKIYQWTHQTTDRTKQEKITNKQGTEIQIPPRRYALELQTTNENTISQQQIQQLKQMAKTHHSYLFAPEPLHNITSTLQLIDQKRNGKHLILYLSNISSQVIRRDIFLETLRILNQYKPGTLWILTGTYQEPVRAYTTPTTDEVIQTLLQRADTIQHLQWQYPPPAPWNRPHRSSILIDHTAQKEQKPAKPIRARTPEQIQNPKNNKRDNVTIPSSSTKITKTATGNKPQEENQVQLSSHSTMENTTTSSSVPTTREETEVDSEDELLTTLVQRLQGAQKSIPHTLRFSFSGGSFYIASVTASKQGVSMVLELEQT